MPEPGGEVHGCTEAIWGDAGHTLDSRFRGNDRAMPTAPSRWVVWGR